MISKVQALFSSHIGHRLMAVVGVVVSVGLILLVLFYTQRQERSILAQNERTLIKVTESVIQGLRTVMQAGYGNIGQTLFQRLQGVGDVVDLRILRIDGVEAFRDNATVHAVNRRLGEDRFPAHAIEDSAAVLPADHPWLRQVVDSGAIASFYHPGPDGERLFTLLAPVANDSDCQACHGENAKVRGVVKLTTSVAKVDADIKRSWMQAIGVLVVTTILTLTIVNFVVGRAVVRPLDRITRAMQRAARGDLTHEVPVLGQDELGRMAQSFNQMIRDLLRMYTGLQSERNKLSTIILGAQEGMVVTDGDGAIVLVNPAAELILEKSTAHIVAEGLLAVLDDPEWIRARRDQPAERTAAETVLYRDKILSVLIGSIRNEAGAFIGAAILIRDITEEVHLQEELQRQSDTDALTGLFNRRYFDQRLADEFALSRRYGTPLSVFLFDVDHFKKFNDTYGHDQGDRVLQAVGRAMAETADKAQVCCRYGGEEFVAILPGFGAAEASEVAERLRQHVADMRVDGLGVTISIGVATTPPCHPSHPEDLVKLADAAMYMAKEGGRNQVQQAAV